MTDQRQWCFPRSPLAPLVSTTPGYDEEISFVDLGPDPVNLEIQAMVQLRRPSFLREGMETVEEGSDGYPVLWMGGPNAILAKVTGQYTLDEERALATEILGYVG